MLLKKCNANIKKVYSINQLRLHPSIIKLKQKIQNSKKLHDVEITYITPRGNWYKYSWKEMKINLVDYFIILVFIYLI